MAYSAGMWLWLLVACVASVEDTSETGTWDRGDNPHPLDDVLRFNHVQALGTHNSTHIEPEFPADDSHRYTQPSLTEQLELGVRQFELDVHLHEDEGFVVFHLPGIDEETTCRALADCLGELKSWSDDNGWHLPLLVWVEPKDDDLDELFDELLTIDDLTELEEAIDAVWPAQRRFGPDDLRGEHTDLPTALAADGWPTLGELRGKIVFSLLDSGEHRERYLAGAPALQGRLMFADTDAATDPWAAMVKDGGVAELTAWAEAGFITTDNVDGADTTDEQASASLAASLDSGTHFLATDLPAPVQGRDYYAFIEGGQPARCNPVTAPQECTAAAIEDLDPDG